MPQHTYVVATDLSYASRRAARKAARMAAAAGAAVDLFCAIPPEVSDDMEGFTARVDTELGNLARLCAKAGTDVTHHSVVARDCVDAVLKHAARLGARLIVVAPHGASGASRFLLGSATEGIARRFQDSLLVARSAPRRDEGRVLIAADGSPGSKRALRTGLRLCKERGAEPYVVRVIAPPSSWVQAEEALTGVNSHHAREDRERRAQAEFETWVRKTPTHGLPLVIRVREGKVVDEILAEARRVNAGLIVIGTQTRSAVESMFLGSTARAVATHGKESVLLVRDQPR